MKKCLMLFITVTMLMDVHIGLAEYGDNMIYRSSGANSYCWNNEYLFVLNGYSRDDEYWWASAHYSLSRVDLKRGYTVTLIKDIQTCIPVLFIDNNVLYLFSQYTPLGPYDGSEGECTLQMLDFNGSHINEPISFSFDYRVEDCIIAKHKFYFITQKEIIEYDIGNGAVTKVYSGNRIMNDVYSAHAILYAGEIYFQDLTCVKALNVLSHEIRNICDLTCIGNDYRYFKLDEEFLVKQHYRYIVYNGLLYYYDHEGGKLIGIDILTGKSIQRIFPECHFEQVCNDGILIYLYYRSDDGSRLNQKVVFLNDDIITEDRFIENGVGVYEIEVDIYELPVLIFNQHYHKLEDELLEGDYGFSGTSFFDYKTLNMS